MGYSHSEFELLTYREFEKMYEEYKSLFDLELTLRETGTTYKSMETSEEPDDGIIEF